MLHVSTCVLSNLGICCEGAMPDYGPQAPAATYQMPPSQAGMMPPTHQHVQQASEYCTEGLEQLVF